MQVGHIIIGSFAGAALLLFGWVALDIARLIRSKRNKP